MHNEKVFDPSTPRPSRESDRVASGEGWGGDGPDHRPWPGMDVVGGSEQISCSFLRYIPRERAGEYEAAGWKICGPADDRGYSFIGEWQGSGEPVTP